MHDPPTKTDHNEIAESSRQQGSNENIMEMLAIMEHKMRERENQLRIQLHMRDEYLDAELKRRDQFLEESIRQRDLKWKKELEERDEMWRVELKEKDEEYWKSIKNGMIVCQECWKE